MLGYIRAPSCGGYKVVGWNCPVGRFSGTHDLRCCLSALSHPNGSTTFFKANFIDVSSHQINSSAMSVECFLVPLGLALYQRQILGLRLSPGSRSRQGSQRQSTWTCFRGSS